MDVRSPTNAEYNKTAKYVIENHRGMKLSGIGVNEDGSINYQVVDALGRTKSGVLA